MDHRTKNGIKIKSIAIKVAKKPSVNNIKAVNLTCRLGKETNCAALMPPDGELVSAESLIVVSLRMPTVGRYVLRAKIITNKGVELHDAVFKREPAPAVYAKDQVSNMSVTEGLLTLDW